MPYSGSLNLVAPAANRVYQRDVRSGNPTGWSTTFNQGWGSVTLGLAPTAPVGSLEYRVRDAALPSGNALQDWTVCASGLAAGPQSVTLTLPARSGWFLLDMRVNADLTSLVSAGPIGMGEVIAASGQSLASDFWGTSATSDPTTIAAMGITPTAFGSCLAAWDGAAPPSSGAAWGIPADGSIYRSTFCAELLRLAVFGSGVNCALVGYAWGGEPIASWRADGSGPKNVWTALTATLDSVGGKFGTFIWCQGHNDARLPQPGTDGDQLTSAQYLAALTGLVTALAGRYPGFAFKRMLSSIPAIGANWITTTPRYVPYYLEQVRQAHLQFVQNDPLALGHVDGLDVALWSDQTHPSQQGSVTFARHAYRAFMRGLGSPAYASGDQGPALASTAARAIGSTQIVLRVQHVGGNSLRCLGGASGAATQFQVFKSGSTLASDQLAITSASLSSANRIILTLASAPPDGQALDVWYRLPPDNGASLLPANQIYDNNISESTLDGLTTGRQLALSAVPIAVPAPLWHRPMLVRPGLPILLSPRTLGFTQ